jgi:5'-3' exonuclease
MTQNYIFIDGSYFVFYRIYAILAWYKLAKKEGIENPIENAEFVEKFKKTFIEKLEEIPKKLKIENPIIIVAKDCPRETIWRMKHMPSYKGNRVYNGDIGSFFELTYKEDLFIKGGVQKIIKYPTLEADDCIAIMARSLKNANITIITSDMDYLQLASDNVEIYDLKYRKLTEKKSSYNCPKKDLFVKILTGDKSDNIEGAFKKCGPVTACKYYDNPTLFHKKLENKECLERYLLNKKMIDFDEIPKELVALFVDKYCN